MDMAQGDKTKSDSPSQSPCHPPSLIQRQPRGPDFGVLTQPPASRCKAPPVRTIPAHMQQILMAPSDNRHKDRGSDFAGWHDDLHQTIPKVVVGVTRKEKMDIPKPCSDSSSDRRGPEPDSSLQSIPSIPRRTSSSVLTSKADNKSRESIKARHAKKRAEANSLGRRITPDRDDSEKSQEDGELSEVHADGCQQECSKAGNKLKEELNSLPQQEKIKDVKTLLVMSLLQHCSAEVGKKAETLMEDAGLEMDPEAEKQEKELPEKLQFGKGEMKELENECSEFLKMMGIRKKGQSLKWQNCLINRMLTADIGSCCREQMPAAVQEQEPDSKELKEFLFSPSHILSDHPSLQGFGLKEGKQSMRSECDVNSKGETVDDPRTEHHLSELFIESQPHCPFRQPVEAVENSFYSFRSTYCNTTHLARMVDSSTFSKRDLKAVLLSLIHSVFVSGGEEKAEMETRPEMKDKEVLSQLHGEVEKDEAEMEEKRNAAEEKPLKIQASEPAELNNVDWDERKSDSVTETEVFEKSDFEELEKAKIGSTAAKPTAPSAMSVIPKTDERGGNARKVSQLSTRQDTGRSGRERKGSKCQNKKKKRQSQQPVQMKKTIKQPKTRGGKTRSGLTVDQTGLHSLTSISSPSGRSNFEITLADSSKEQIATGAQATRGLFIQNKVAVPLLEDLDQAPHADTVKTNLAGEERSLKTCTSPVHDLLHATGKLPLEKVPKDDDDVTIPADKLHDNLHQGRQEEDSQAHQTRDVTSNLHISVMNQILSSSITSQNPSPWRKSHVPQKLRVKNEGAKKCSKTTQTTAKKRSQRCKKKTSFKVQNSTVVTTCISLALPKQKTCHSLPQHILKPHHPLRVRDKKNHFPGRSERVDVRRADVIVVATSAGMKGGSNSGGQGGNSTGSNNQRGGSSGQGWGGARPKANRRNGSNGDGDDEDREDKRPSRGNIPGSLPLVASGENPRGEDPPSPDYKRHRKKQHGTITNEQFCHCLGQAGLGIHKLRQSRGAGELNRCLLLCLHETDTVTSPSLDDLTCCTCAILHSLLSHFTAAAHDSNCSMCLQLFTLVHFHVQECLAGRRDREEGEGDLSRNVCHKMRQAGMFANNAVTVSSTKVWMKMRKYLNAVLGPVLLLDLGVQAEEVEPASFSHQDQPLPCGADSGAQYVQQRPAVKPTSECAPQAWSGGAMEEPPQNVAAFRPSTAAPLAQGSSDPSQSHVAVMPKSTPGGSLRRRPSTRVVPQKTIPEEPSTTTPPASPAEEADKVIPPNLVDQEALPNMIPRPAETPDEGEEIMSYIRSFAEKSKEKLSRLAPDDPYSTQRTYGVIGTVSMPEPRDRLIVVEQNLSVEMQPIGVPGIGEVVYGTRQQLLIVARNWRQERDECKASGRCRYQHREEGVILHAFKKQLKILHTRYQKHHQWERLVHLGNGVTGKCHLCIDRTSDFRFCCKKMHILHYEDQELDIWSELNHPNIVRFYGAIRHGEKIYMFAEFIDGGSLAALIKEQWTVQRRLSHWMALNYFRQLLDVLTYLQSMSVLHEDIKADNLLVRHGTTEIVLADFGVAQQIPHDHTPPNRFPTGSPAHWSPEKAASEGHGFPSDLWASACVLIHMLGGSPPWIGRYPDAAILNFIIWSKPAPIADIPDNVKESVRDLISSCLVKDKAIRPTAKQMLAHPAFQLLDQSSSFFSNFAQPGAGLPADLATHRPQQAPHQTEEGAVGGFNPDVGTTALTVARVVSSVSATVSETKTRLSVGVVEAPHSSHDDRVRPSQPRPGNISGPQSLPASLPVGGRPVRTPQDGDDSGSPQQRPAMQRKSAPASSAPFLTQESLEQEQDIQHVPRPEVKEQSTVITTSSSSFEMALLLGAGVTSTNTVRSTRISDDQSTDLRLQPEPWPDVPSPALTLASRVSSIQEKISLVLSKSSGHPSDTTLSVSSPRGRGAAGPTSLHGGNSGGIVSPTTLQTSPVVSATSEGVPASATFNMMQSRTASPSGSVGQGDSPDNLVSHGTSLESLSPQLVEPSTLRKQQPYHQQTPAALSSLKDAQSVIGQPANASTVSSSCAKASQLMKTPQNGDPGPGKLLTIPPPESSAEQRTVASGGVPVALQAGNTPDPPNSVLLTTSNRSTGVASVMLSVDASSPVVSGHTSFNQARSAGSTPYAQCQSPGPPALCSALYPEYPALSVEDFQVPGKGCGMTQLSMIPEVVEQESLSPSAQQNSSCGSSDGHMWNYLQDQFSVPTENQHQQGQAPGSRLTLQLYNAGDSAGAEHSLQQRLMALPKFELLETSLSDCSTLQSGRNAPSSGEMIPLESQSQSPAPGPGFNPMSGVGSAPEQVPFTAQQTLDDPDLAYQLAHGGENVTSNAVATTQGQGDQANLPLTQASSDEDHISSGDMFGSGPSSNPSFQEVLQYRQGQSSLGEEQQRGGQQQSSNPSPSAFPRTDISGAVSPCMSRKHPNLRLDVTKPTILASTPCRPSASNRQSQRGSEQASQSTLNNSEYSTHTQLQVEDVFNTGMSPLTASPVVTPGFRPHESRPRSSNGSGSSLSTPRSSTYDKQEQEWTVLQRQTPGFTDMLLPEDPIVGSGSEHSSTQHLSLLYDSHGEASVSSQEESSMLSILQEGIREPFGGQRLVFTDPKGAFLFDMRVLGPKWWKELATTFRGKICKTGDCHFKLVHQDGQTQVDYFSRYNPTITTVIVVDLSEERSDISSVCWCDNHLIY